MKSLLTILLATLILLSLQALLLAIPCDNVSKNYVPACELANKYNIQLKTVVGMQTIAIIEVAGNKCGFKFSDEFRGRKNSILTDPINAQVYREIVAELISGDPPMRVDKQRCAEFYKQFGPNGSSVDRAGMPIRVYQ